MTEQVLDTQATIPPVGKTFNRLGIGTWQYGGREWVGQAEDQSREAMAACIESGMNHIDTAIDYGAGASEKFVGQFLQDTGVRDQVFLATKGNVPPEFDSQTLLNRLDQSLEHLQVNSIDLYYIHWPKSGKDMKPVLEGMERARQDGRIKAIGVSNFSVEQMQDVASVAKIDAHQLCYNLFWRWDEADIIPYCIENNIQLVTYSSILQGILTGKFPEKPEFPEGDVRNSMLMFDDDVWPQIYAGIEQLKKLAEAESQPLVNLAIQWVARQPGVNTVLLGARNAQQAKQNAAALDQPISDDTIRQMSAIADEVMKSVPDAGNIFRYYP